MPAAEQRPEVAGGEDVDGERLGHAAAGRMGADVVAVVEHHGAAVAQGEHGADVADHRGQRQRLELAGVTAAQRRHLLQAQPGGHVAGAQVVGRGEVGDDVGDDLALEQPLEQVRGVGDDRDRPGSPASRAARAASSASSTVFDDEIDDARLTRRADLLAVEVGDQADAVQHAGDRDRLRRAHAAQAAADDQSTAQAAAEVLARHLGERLVGALEHALGADVLPAARGEPTPGDEVATLEVVEHLRRGPAADEVAVGQQDGWGPRTGGEHGDRLAASARPASRRRAGRCSAATMPPEALVVTRRLGVRGVDHQVLGILGDREVVLEQAQDRLLAPAAAAQAVVRHRQSPRLGPARPWPPARTRRRPDLPARARRPTPGARGRTRR